MDKRKLTRRILVAGGKKPADCVLKNAQVIDVFSGEIFVADVAIADGMIAGIGGAYEGHSTINADGKWLCPSFIDGHVHIESSMVTPAQFAKAVLPHGVTTVIADPHEIANVSGIAGIQFMLDASERLPLDVYLMLPSSVPAAEYEQSGAIVGSNDLKPFYHHPRVLGLAEVMNYPAVMNANEGMIAKITDAIERGKKIDGHAAGLNAHQLNVYMAAHIRTDHECTTIQEAMERLQKGMYVMIREGTIAKDLNNVIGAVNEKNSRRFLFVTDDRHLDDIICEGSVDHNVRMAIAAGIQPVTAIQMATLNAAECFGLSTHGAIAPGYKADFLLLDDLETVQICSVFKDGQLIVDKGQLQHFPSEIAPPVNENLTNTVHFNKLSHSDLQINLPSTKANVIEIIPNSLITKHMIEDVDVDSNNHFCPSIGKDFIKMTVIERHMLTGQIGLGIVKGFGIKNGAIASTVAHDSHNLIITGVKDEDILAAAAEIKKMQGGLVVIQDGKKLAGLELSIAGLLSRKSYEKVNQEIGELNEALLQIGISGDFNPFLTLGFLALPVIPDIKLTSKGLFSVSQSKHISVGLN